LVGSHFPYPQASARVGEHRPLRMVRRAAYGLSLKMKESVIEELDLIRARKR
jgi:hypothetical protein